MLHTRPLTIWQQPKTICKGAYCNACPLAMAQFRARPCCTRKRAAAVAAAKRKEPDEQGETVHSHGNGIVAPLAALALPWLLPGIVAAATDVQEAHYKMVDDHAMYMGCAALGVAFSVLTFCATSRFLLSLWPSLQKRAQQHRGPMAFRALLLLDALLNPAQRGLFRLDVDDVNYASMALLAIMSVVLEVLFGSQGVLTQSVPDGELLHSLQYMVYVQHMILLPQWALAVFRWFSLI